METAQKQLEAVLLLKTLGDGKANPFFEKPKRKRVSFTPIWIVYQIHLYQKNVDRGIWTDIHTMKETIADNAGISRTSVTNFFNSKIKLSDLFVGVARYSKRKNGKYQSNRYWLKPGMAEVLHFFERVGMFRNFKNNPLKWRKTFDARLEKWVIPLLEKGLTLQEIWKGHMNILSTEKKAKLAAAEPRKLADTTLPPEDSFTTLTDINNPVAEPIKQFTLLYGKMKDRLHIPEWQIKGFVGNNALSLLSSAVDETIRWTSGEWQPRRMPALLQKKINEQRSRRNL